MDAGVEPGVRGATQFCTQVVVHWGDDVIHVVWLRVGERFVLGDGAGAWAFPTGQLGPRHTLVECLPAAARVLEPGQQPLDIPQGSRTELCVDAFRFVVTAEQVHAPTRRWRSGAQRSGFAGWWLGSLLLNVGALLVAAYTRPPLGEEQVLLASAGQSPPHVLPKLIGAAPTELAEPMPDVARWMSPWPRRLDGWSACGHELDMGADAPARDARYALSGPKDNPDPHFAEVRGPRRAGHDDEPKWTSPAPLQPLAEWSLDPDALTAPWGRPSVLGRDDQSAAGHMWGETRAASAGGGIEGKRAELGGKAKHIDVAPRRVPSAHHLRLVHEGEAQVLGALDAETVERSLVGHLQALRSCLLTAPGEPRSVQLNLEIRASGAVERRWASPALDIDATEIACLLDVLGNVVFLEVAGGTTVLGYSLSIIPATGAHEARADG